MNIDNYPTHRATDPETGEVTEYCAASKQWNLVDPAASDRKSLHYAGEDRVYLIVQNKYTGEWEFPVSKLHFNTTLLRAKLDLFIKLTNNKWRIKFFGSNPVLQTLREFTNVEKRDIKNEQLHGVRTLYFGANHLRGVPELFLDDAGNPNPEMIDTDYCDWCWVPKRQLNEYFSRENYEVFIHSLRTR